jgi:glycosyltransferase involved in cell wall biosynthesis
LVVGQGPELPALQRQARETVELSNRVVFFGASDQVEELFNAMDVFVLPSLGEGMSNTLLEAMASALPVVATRVGGNPELIDDGLDGFMFTPGDAVGLADIIERALLDGASRERFGAAAREKVVQEFSLQRMVANYRDLYTSLATRRGIGIARLGRDSVGAAERT